MSKSLPVAIADPEEYVAIFIAGTDSVCDLMPSQRPSCRVTASLALI